MPYSSFTIEEVESKFNLNLQTGHFLPNIDPISPSLMLEQFLNITLPLARETRVNALKFSIIENSHESATYLTYEKHESFDCKQV